MDVVTTGTLHGLARRIGKIGGEHITFVITTRDLEAWNRLVGITEGEVEITLRSQQGDLGLCGERGEEGADGDPDGSPRESAGQNGDTPPARAPRQRKEPKGRHAAQDEPQA